MVISGVCITLLHAAFQPVLPLICLIVFSTKHIEQTYWLNGTLYRIFSMTMYQLKASKLFELTGKALQLISSSC